MGLETYQKGMNKFHDLSREEFILAHTGLRKPKIVNSKVLGVDNTTKKTLSSLAKPSTTSMNLPISVDYRSISGYIQPIKDQGYHFSSNFNFL